MKKTISVNISGMLFHVEEDGYEMLRKYLDDIRRYFSAMEGHGEVVTDIENRIAEVFAAKLNESKQVITLDDVEKLVSTMGNVNDFRAAEESEPEPASAPEQGNEIKQPRKLYRDNKRKIIGGVCAGIANYVSIDPIWIRVVLALLVYASYGSLILAYLIVWAVMPGSDELSDESASRSMYRDQKTGVLGGVASGLAQYFNTDVVIIRLLFVILAFIGFGIVLYIILWIALPNAETLTERMSMSGEPVTLSNIEKRIKDKVQPGETKENTLTKILLFPFRLLARVIEALGPIAKGILKALRIFAGITLLIISIALIAAILIAGGILAGIISGNGFFGETIGFPTEAFLNTFPTLFVFAAVMVALVPMILLTLLGRSLIAGRMLFGRYAGLSLTAIFVLGLIACAAYLPGLIAQFAEGKSRHEEQTFTINAKTPRLEAGDEGLSGYQATYVQFHGQSNQDIRVVRQFTARGRNRKEAVENSKTIQHELRQRDSVLIIGTGFGFAPEATFHGQELRVDIYLPTGKKVLVDRDLMDLSNMFPEPSDDTLGYDTLMADSTGTVHCLTCPAYGRSGSGKFNGIRVHPDLRDFDGVDLSGAFDTRIIRGDAFAIAIRSENGNDQDALDAVDIHVEDGVLHISPEARIGFGWRHLADIEIEVTMPHLRTIDASGAGKIYVDGFREESAEIDISGAVHANVGLEAKTLEIEITGASELELIGKGENLEAEISGASEMKAVDYKVRTARLDVSGASKARVNVSERLNVDKGRAAEIENRGAASIENQ